jgi:hypothetical protein
MPTDLPRFESNERVDLTDTEYMVDESPQALVRQLNEEFLTDPDGSVKSWILDGFAMTGLAGGTLTVTKGRAMLAQREVAEIHYGALTTEGDATKTLDLSGYANNDYNVYIRFQYVDAETQSRMFWNPSGSGTEFAQSIQTRRQANWSLRVELASPANEWVKIGEVTVAAAVITKIKDMRNFYFEGVENSQTLLGNWNWNGTTTVAATDTTQVAVNDWVCANSDGQFFKITAETPNVDVTIENPHGYTIPNLGVTPSSWIAAAAAPPYQSGWSTDGGGAANDRHLSRRQYGVKDLQTFTAAVRQLFEDLRPTGGRWWEKRGLKATGLSGSGEPGFDGIADGAGAGIRGTASGASNSSVGVSGVGDVSGAATTSDGMSGTGAGTDGHGVVGAGAGTGPGVKGTASGASNLSVGIEGIGDVSGAATSSDGVSGTGAGANAVGVLGTGAGTGAGVGGRGSTTGAGVRGVASGADNASVGIEGLGDTSGAATTSNGVSGTGAGTDGHGVVGAGAGTGPGIKGTASGANNLSVGIEGVGDASGAATTSDGISGTGAGTDGHGVVGAGAGTGPGIKGTASGANNASVGVEGFGDVSGAATTSDGINGTGAGTDGHGVVGLGAGTGPGVKGTGGATGSGVEGISGHVDAFGVSGTGAATGAYGVVATGIPDPTAAGAHAAFRIVPQTATPPNVLENGAIWIVGATMYVRLNGVTKTVDVS